MTMANGSLTPPQAVQAPSSPGSLKRKRSETTSAIQSNGTTTAKVENAIENGEKLQLLLADIHVILKK